jgi:signal transduction histidine kinase
MLLDESALSHAQLRRLLAVGESLVAELDPEALLGQVLESARELTDARYAALGILDSEKAGLERFLHLGMDDETVREIGSLPKGRGVLGELIRDPRPLRLQEVGEHPRSYGFPAGHPRMSSFLGAPVKIHGEVFGNLYLTEKRSGEQFDDRDESMLVLLANWAAVAIQNARVYTESESRRTELERAVRALEATITLSRASAIEADLDSILELVARRCRALIDSRSLLVLVPNEHGGLSVGSVAGDADDQLTGLTLAPQHAALAAARREGTVQRLGAGLSGLGEGLGLSAASALLVHMEYRGHSQGYLLALDPVARQEFSADDELVLASFAGGQAAAGALATARDAERERLRLSIEASERERRHWARELHDETLQELGALKVAQDDALRRGDERTMRRSLAGASAQLEVVIDSLESLINELRPASLDELGVAAAIEALVQRVSKRGGIEAETMIDLAHDRGNGSPRLGPELEATIYRVVQEALNNAVKHAGGTRAAIEVREAEGRISVTVEDDGQGFLLGEGPGDRFGLRGMRERVELADGELLITSTPGSGTRLQATLPVTDAE